MSGSVTPGCVEAARISDVQQAEYFHRVLSAEQKRLTAAVTETRQKWESAREAGSRTEANTLHVLLRELECELSQVEWLVAQLEKRFADQWSAD
jgi:hypothetical protein